MMFCNFLFQLEEAFSAERSQSAAAARSEAAALQVKNDGLIAQVRLTILDIS